MPNPTDISQALQNISANSGSPQEASALAQVIQGQAINKFKQQSQPSQTAPYHQQPFGEQTPAVQPQQSPGNRRPSPFQMMPVKSSNLNEVGYDEQSQQLHITFKSKSPKDTVTGGHTKYVHSNFSPSDFEAFMKAPSKGSFYQTKIRN